MGPGISRVGRDGRQLWSLVARRIASLRADLVVAARGRGRGFATEASKAVIDFGYEVLGWDLVETHMNDDNLAARRLVERLGGTVIAREEFPDGVTRNVYKLPRTQPAR